MKLLRLKHIVLLMFAYFFFSWTLFLSCALFLCYFLFAKGFMVHTYCPMHIETMEYLMEYHGKVIDNELRPTQFDNRFKYYMKENAQFTLSKLHYIYHTDKDKYQRMVEGAGNFGFIVMPILLPMYFKFKKMNRYLRHRLDK